jgi:hypothetical protein
MLALSPVRKLHTAGPSFPNRFENMIPEIRRHVRSTFHDAESRSIDESVASAVEDAFDIFTRLSEHGLNDLVYPRPLAMAALARLKQAAWRGIRG